MAADAPMDVEPTRTLVLVIDDDPSTLELVRTVLEANGHACLTATSAEEALEIIRATPNIVIAISDIDMPGMDGIAFLERVNVQGGPQAPRVILLTAYPSVDYAVAALRLGAIDFLTKPVRPQTLLSVVRNAEARVQRDRAASSLQEQVATFAQQAEVLAAALKGWVRTSPQENAPAGAQPLHESGATQPLDFALLGLDHLRRLRRAFPPLGEIDDVAWDLLRELLRVEKTSQRLSVSALSASIEDVSATTALRRIQELVKAGHIIRVPDPTDARRDFVALSPEIRGTLEQYLIRVAHELAAVAGSST